MFGGIPTRLLLKLHQPASANGLAACLLIWEAAWLSVTDSIDEGRLLRLCDSRLYRREDECYGESGFRNESPRGVHAPG